MKKRRTVIVKPVFTKRHVLRGWKWEALDDGHVVAHGGRVHRTIEAARAAGQEALREATAT